jgi:hypothetical protein
MSEMGQTQTSAKVSALQCGMPDRIRIIAHEAVPLCGSYEVRLPDGRSSRYSIWMILPAGGCVWTCSQANRHCTTLTRSEQDKPEAAN